MPTKPLISKNSEYGQEIAQSQTADKNPWHREEEPHNNHETPGRQTKQRNQLPPLHQDHHKTRTDTKFAQRTTKHRTTTDPTTGVITNNKSTTAKPPPQSSQIHPRAQMHFTGTKSSPQILPPLKHKKRSAHMEAFQPLQCITTEKH